MANRYEVEFALGRRPPPTICGLQPDVVLLATGSRAGNPIGSMMIGQRRAYPEPA